MDFCWDPWQVSALCPSRSPDSRRGHRGPLLCDPSPGTQSCHPGGGGLMTAAGGTVLWEWAGSPGEGASWDGSGREMSSGRSALPYSPIPSFLQRCFQTTNGYLADSRSCSSNYNVAALATSSLVGRFQGPSPAPGLAQPVPCPCCGWRACSLVEPTFPGPTLHARICRDEGLRFLAPTPAVKLLWPLKAVKEWPQSFGCLPGVASRPPRQVQSARHPAVGGLPWKQSPDANCASDLWRDRSQGRLVGMRAAGPGRGRSSAEMGLQEDSVSARSLGAQEHESNLRTSSGRC